MTSDTYPRDLEMFLGKYEYPKQLSTYACTYIHTHTHTHNTV